MIKEITAVGKDIIEAKDNARIALGAGELDDVQFEIIDGGTKGILGLFSMLVPCMTLKERNIVLPPREDKKVKIDYKLILLNRPLLLLCLANCVESIRKVCYNSLPFFYKQTLGRYGMKTYVEMGSTALSYTGLFSVPFIGKKLSSMSLPVHLQYSCLPFPSL